ncbi:DNA alkylation repair protein [Actinomadura alba]|uniref:DNA alkylation repair protein n=1 Tax=Actinomadura alba TaxID=406431 RepID=A0ABR7LIJ4_9ACTN|nr:DNA alkylation repair protein [Actinomadura alba]MBC6464603.1 DNA alkylation repair protein [Actinomadura alba]
MTPTQVAVVLERVEAELRAQADPVRAVQEKRYLKSDLAHIGVPVPAIRKVAVAAARAQQDRAGILALAEPLWTAAEDGTPVHELRVAAIEVLIRRVRLLEPADLRVVERLVRDSRSWVYVDALADKVAGALVLRTPAQVTALDRWAADPCFWIRRTALLALLPGIRTGDADLARLSRYGDMMIGEREFFIRKALGWVLRELSKRDPAWVRAWVAERIPVISGVTFREAVRRLPEPDREVLDAAYRAR